MAEVLRSFDGMVSDGDHLYTAMVVGRQADDEMWEAWLEFVPADGSSDVLATGVESRQPERGHLAYWASGLSGVYVEGALQRARNPIAVRVRMEEPPVTEVPAPRPVVVESRPPAPEPILDPFELGSKSLDLLRQELAAFNRPRLLTIIDAYDLNPGSSDMAWMSNGQLITFIVTAVEAIMVRGR